MFRVFRKFLEYSRDLLLTRTRDHCSDAESRSSSEPSELVQVANLVKIRQETLLRQPVTKGNSGDVKGT